MRGLMALAALLLAGCTTPTPGGGGAAASNSPVAFSMSSWGRPVKQWSVGADGTGELSRIENRADFTKFDLARYRIHLDRDAMAALHVLLNPLRQQVASKIRCDMRIADAPYGEIIWTDGQQPESWTFNQGCLSDEAERAYAALGEATDLVETRAKIDAAPFATEHFGPR